MIHAIQYQILLKREYMLVGSQVCCKNWIERRRVLVFIIADIKGS